VTVLRLDEVTTYYGEMRILEGVSLEVGEGELVCLLGGNASGKSTTLKTVLGLVRPRSGRVEFLGEDVTERSTSRRIALGMAIVPENRRLFAPLTVEENLELGAYLRHDGVDEALERVFELFPRLLERRTQLAGTLSGGEQQMLALARALMARPRLLMLDEPTTGLAPIIAQSAFEALEGLKNEGMTLLIAEQQVPLALSVADRGYVLENGRIGLSGTSEELDRNPEVQRAYLGVA
jgi:branched-chain amino acid transport system ATP-binding protein